MKRLLAVLALLLVASFVLAQELPPPGSHLPLDDPSYIPPPHGWLENPSLPPWPNYFAEVTLPEEQAMHRLMTEAKRIAVCTPL